MEKRIEITFDELKNGSMKLYEKYCKTFGGSNNALMVLAMYHQAFMITCHQSADQLKSVKGKKTLSVGIGSGKFGNLIDFEIAREGEKFVATEPLFDAGTFADGGFSPMDIIGTLQLSSVYAPKLPVAAVFGEPIKSVIA